MNVLTEASTSRLEMASASEVSKGSLDAVSVSFRSAGSSSRGRESSSDGDDDFRRNAQNKVLGRAKVAILFFLLGLAGITTWLWWKASTEYRSKLYRIEFQQYGETVIQTFLERVRFRALAATALATSLSTQAMEESMDWPYVSVPNFERRVASTRMMTRSTSLWFSPLVSQGQRRRWEAYASENHELLTNETFIDPLLMAKDDDTTSSIFKSANWSVSKGIYRFDDDKARSQENDNSDGFMPIWQAAPSQITTGISMFDQSSDPMWKGIPKNLVDTPLFSASYLGGDEDTLIDSYPKRIGPHAFLYSPIFRNLTMNPPKVVGSVTLDMTWQSFWDSSIHGIPEPLYVVLIGSSSSCGGAFTFQLDDVRNNKTYFVGEGQPSFSSDLNLQIETTFGDFATKLGLGSVDDDVCQYRIQVKPTEAFESRFLNRIPLLSGLALGGIFVITAVVFLCYDHFVQIRQSQILSAATKSTKIIKSLFPKGIRKQLLQDGVLSQNQRFENMLPEDYDMAITNRMRLQNYLLPSTTHTRTKKSEEATGGEPIAEFFPSVSVMFADLAGFTAWSSSREPAQVFTLLEALYGAMDKAGKRLGVFKVETIGDCYVAATGMPDPRPDHAVLMVTFANLCLTQIRDLTDALESQLGPGTGDLAFRIGIHSGPVTAGVLRGEKSRFQLFGDTMTTCGKVEATGKPGRIHVSSATADMLIAHGKAFWLTKSGETVAAVGRGELVTYWVKTDSRKESRSRSVREVRTHSSIVRDQESKSESGDGKLEPSSSGHSRLMSEIDPPSSFMAEGMTEKNYRLVDYNVDVMMSLLKKILAKRSVVENTSPQLENTSRNGSIALDEVRDFIPMPKYNEEVAVKLVSDYRVEIPEVVRQELREYIIRIQALYPPNAFHNFEHASHVALSASKLLKRIVMPEDINYRHDSKESRIEKLLAVTKELHHHTLGISSDPVAQFAVVFASLIHDVMHPGVPNGRFAIEKPDLAVKYRSRSMAEQRSVDIAWEILAEDCFKNFQSCIFPTVSELLHFRRLVVNMVMATDLFDKEMSALRQARWERSFHSPALGFPDDLDDFDRKATLVLENIIQASDVAHTMQHWHIYVKWNERLFFEMYHAFKEGRSAMNPIHSWYTGELWFFDNYVIPLAHKLKECGTFGVSGTEYLQYATENRDEWERKGESICGRLISRYEEGMLGDRRLSNSSC